MRPEDSCLRGNDGFIYSSLLPSSGLTRGPTWRTTWILGSRPRMTIGAGCRCPDAQACPGRDPEAVATGMECVSEKSPPSAATRGKKGKTAPGVFVLFFCVIPWRIIEKAQDRFTGEGGVCPTGLAPPGTARGRAIGGLAVRPVPSLRVHGVVLRVFRCRAFSGQKPLRNFPRGPAPGPEDAPHRYPLGLVPRVHGGQSRVV